MEYYVALKKHETVPFAGRRSKPRVFSQVLNPDLKTGARTPEVLFAGGPAGGGVRKRRGKMRSKHIVHT
jgi:hypothetical protein